MGLYTQEQAESVHFASFLESSLRAQPGAFDDNQFWMDIASGMYNASRAREMHIRSPIHRLCHRLIASTITHRKGNEKVSQTDIFYLWCLLTPARHLNIPSAVATFLGRMAIGRAHSPILGGHFVTRLAASYGFLTQAVKDSMVSYPNRVMSVRVLETMKVLRTDPDGVIRIPEDDAIQHPPPPQIQPQPEPQPQEVPVHPPRSHRRRTRAQAGLDDDDILRSIVAMSEHIQWQTRAIQLLAAHQGVVLPAAPPQTRSADEAGPSGAQRDDSEEEP